jgi:multidrug transporter EmrE-like cation transporter
MNLLLPLTGLLAGSETIAMTAITKYSKNKNILFMLVGLAIYGIIIPFIVLKTLTFAGIGIVNFMWNIITTVSMIIIGHFYFGDKMSNLHLISLMLGIASITVLYVAEKS